MARSDSEAGIAMITVVLVSMVISLFTAWLVNEAFDRYDDSVAQRWEDVTIAGTEAMLDRYASKLTIDPAYYLHWVDEAERARRCTTTASAGNGQVVQPGQAWFSDCEVWTYQDPVPNTWFRHPLLAGGPGPADDVETRLQVTPPGTSTPVIVTVASRQAGRKADRIVSSAVRATALSEFFRVTEENLSYGGGAEIFGRVYSGADLAFDGSPDPIVHNDVYAEDDITNPPVFKDGSKGWDSGGPPYGNIREIFPQPLSFAKFWNDLAVLKSAACSGGGICLQASSTTAWRVQPVMVGGVAKIKVWRSTYSPSSLPYGCTQEEWWWTVTQGSTSPSWTPYTAEYAGGVYPMPRNGALWANAHVVVGLGYNTADASVVGGSLTIYAGTEGGQKNIIVNGDVNYDVTGGTSVLGLVASKELIINPRAVGTDNALTLNASILAQNDQWRVARKCGDNDVLTPSNSTLYANGSIATPLTGDIAASFATRVYGFDERLEFLRPPFFPLLNEGWRYEDWKELGRPAWAA